MGALYKNEVSNSCAIQLNRHFGQVNFVPGDLGNRDRKAIKVESHVHWVHSIRRESVVAVLFKTSLMLLIGFLSGYFTCNYFLHLSSLTILNY